MNYEKELNDFLYFVKYNQPRKGLINVLLKYNNVNYSYKTDSSGFFIYNDGGRYMPLAFIEKFIKDKKIVDFSLLEVIWNAPIKIDNFIVEDIFQ